MTTKVASDASILKRTIERLTHVLKSSPSHVLALNNRGCAYVRLGESMQAEGRDGLPYVRLAAADFDRALSLVPSFAASFVNRGSARWLLGDRDHARQDWACASFLRPDYRGLFASY